MPILAAQVEDAESADDSTVACTVRLSGLDERSRDIVGTALDVGEKATPGTSSPTVLSCRAERIRRSVDALGSFRVLM